MKKIGLIISLSALLLACGGETNKVEIGQKTTISVEPVFEGGKVLLGGLVEAKFTVENTGDYPLIISEVKGSCSCTVADYPEEPIAPGESGEIHATVKTVNAKPGKLTKEVRLIANTDPSITLLHVNAEVVRK